MFSARMIRDAVQAQLSSWDKFNAVAEKASEKGYKMLSGYDDAYRVFSNNVSAPWLIPIIRLSLMTTL